jgi:putative ubiquitin-RnfH superfamily antitoxin RatB of RatAB toxin-antitoxin module
MSERHGKRCLVAVDTPAGPLLCEVQLAVDDDIEAALQGARRKLGEGVIDWQGALVGLWGQCQARAVIPADGDRIELYRPLSADPRQRRRQRARSALKPRAR